MFLAASRAELGCQHALASRSVWVLTMFLLCPWGANTTSVLLFSLAVLISARRLLFANKHRLQVPRAGSDRVVTGTGVTARRAAVLAAAVTGNEPVPRAASWRGRQQTAQTSAPSQPQGTALSDPAAMPGQTQRNQNFWAYQCCLQSHPSSSGPPGDFAHSLGAIIRCRCLSKRLDEVFTSLVVLFSRELCLTGHAVRCCRAVGQKAIGKKWIFYLRRGPAWHQTSKYGKAASV